MLKFGYRLSCSRCFPAQCRCLVKGCGFFVPKWVWLGISKVRDRFQSRSSLFSQNRAILLVFRLLQYWNSAITGYLALCLPAKCRLLAKGCGFFVPKWVWLGIFIPKVQNEGRSNQSLLAIQYWPLHRTPAVQLHFVTIYHTYQAVMLVTLLPCAM